jgi:DNA-directed RNA polymerase specialized sigma24 family protein
MAHVTGVSTGTVKSRVWQARQKLKRALKTTTAL